MPYLIPGESVIDVLIVLCGKDDNIENLRLLVHESILLANSVGARGQRLSTSNPSTDTPAAKGMNVSFYLFSLDKFACPSVLI